MRDGLPPFRRNVSMVRNRHACVCSAPGAHYKRPKIVRLINRRGQRQDGRDAHWLCRSEEGISDPSSPDPQPRRCWSRSIFSGCLVRVGIPLSSTPAPAFESAVVVRSGHLLLVSGFASSTHPSVAPRREGTITKSVTITSQGICAAVSASASVSYTPMTSFKRVSSRRGR